MRLLHQLLHRRRSKYSPSRTVRPQAAGGRFAYERHSLRTFLILRFLSIGLLVSTLAGILVFLVVAGVVSASLPNPQNVVRSEGFSTKILDRNGNLLYDVFENERIVPIVIEDVPDYLKKATIAIEDKDFYRHGGFDPLTPLRMVQNYLLKGRVIGGSTLTQQLVKNVLLDNRRTPERKFKELLLSMQIENAFTKDQILQMYLNETPYGGNSRGVGAAAEQYLGKKVQDLTLVESAILAGLPQRPSVYSPTNGKTDPSTGQGYWIERTRGVLRRMREDGYITVDQEKQANDELVTMQFDRSRIEIKAPHFVFYVKDQLEQEYGEQVLETGGLTVTTTLDLTLQETAQLVTKEEIAKVAKLKITNGAAMAMNPKNGEILAMVGSKDYFAEDITGQFNVAVDGLRQPGSSIKPVTYLLAFQRGFTPASMVVDSPTIFPVEGGKDYEPKNYDGKFRGPVQLRFALGNSLNIPAVKMLSIVGVKDMLTLAHEMGFKTLEPTAENMRRFGLSVTLGGGEVHLIDSVSAYSSVANGGHRVDPVSILKIQDRTGKTLFEHKPTLGKQVFSEAESFLLNHVLSDNNARLAAFGPNSQLNVSGKPIAVKTGTTNNQVDNWTIGWSRNVMVGVWVGNNDNTPMKSVASGLTGASPIWRRIMLAAIEQGYKDEEWPIPSGVEAKQVDTISGYPEHDGFSARTEYVLTGTLPSLPDPIHTKLKLCRGQNKLASEADLARNEFDEKEYFVLKESDPVSKDGKNRWQEGIDGWISSQGDEKYRPPTELCGSSSDVFVAFDKPRDKDNISGTDVELEVRTATDGTIDRVEVYVNDALKSTLRDRPYRTKIVLDPGRYKLFARAYRNDGQVGTTTDQYIGVGGISWESTPAPTPSPTPSPTASPSPTPTAAP